MYPCIEKNRMLCEFATIYGYCGHHNGCQYTNITKTHNWNYSHSNETEHKSYIAECPVCKGVLEHIEGLDSHAGDFNGSTTSNLSYRCPNCKSSVNVITEEQNNEIMFMRTVYRKNGYEEHIKII